MSPIKIALSDDFLYAFAAIPRAQQQGVVKFMAKFRQNPTSPGINYEKINDAADAAMRSVRIDIDYRGIVLKPERGDVYCLLWVDKHDDAYTWARKHKVVVNSELGTLQVLEVGHGQAEPSERATPADEGLFRALKDRELTRLGVPEGSLPLVRSITSVDRLEANQPLLPDDAFEMLYLFAAGESYENLVREREKPSVPVDISDFASALDRDESKRHFLVITDDVDLDKILAEPLARWRVFLHPTQRKLVEREWNGPVRVLGGAGTGKTVAAIHRAAWLARKHVDVQGKPVLFTTFTRTLSDDIREQVATITTPVERERIEVTNIDQWALSVLRRAGYKHELLFDEKKRRDLWARALTRKPVTIELPDTFYRAEFERVVLPQGCQTEDDYLRATRVGRGVQLNRSTRRALWPVFAEYRAQLRSENLREPEEAYLDALSMLRQGRVSLGIRSIVVDEAQDLSPAAYALLRAAVPEGPNDIFIVGDAHQRIYRHKVSLSKVGIDIRGRGRRLRVNYRTTDEIRKWAVSQLVGCAIDDLDGQPDTLVGYRSLSHGAAPEVVDSPTRMAEREILKSAIEKVKGEGIATQGICVVARTNPEADEYAQWLKSLGENVLKLERGTPDIQDTPGVRVATMHRVKGLEFDAVIVAGYRTPQYYAEHFGDDEDAGVVLDNLTRERCLLHVAATRAKRYLLVSHISG
ncbi:UvrD-helicase domain-containing protein [Burkholderia vietnamiensis]|uniref:UvrD-helicase domain-containing protein n=1 Tax=Burkholderia vietnamiensis TaxID=60552 RepID=UPI001CABBD51|nr:UvrD-helicase domain-containing protein [Burkholderia vietnamiensis]CAG9235015.1 DNA helicase [Burkholderia vietnamiensis]